MSSVLIGTVCVCLSFCLSWRCFGE